MGYQIEFRHFRYFLALAEDLHFKKAAERLYISQPGLSRQIKQMEKGLSIVLFKRTNRKVEITEAGLYLKEELEGNFKRLDDILSHAKLLNDGIDGKLKFGYVGSAMQKIIPDLLLQFKHKHPSIFFSLNEMDNKTQIQALLSHKIDIGFVRLERVPRGLEILNVFEDTFSLVLPINHQISKSNFRDLSQLKDESFISFNITYSESYYEKVMQIYDNCGFSPNISHYTVNANSIFRLVESGFGVAIVPTSLKLGYDMNVKFIELKNIPQRTTLKTVWSSSNTNPILKTFLNVINNYVKLE